MGARRDKGNHGTETRTHVAEMLAALHLPGMRAAYDGCTRTAARENLGCEGFLRMLLERETETREARRIERLAVQSRLPHGKTFATFERHRLPLGTARMVEALGDGGFLRQFKRAMEQALLLRGSRDFPSEREYEELMQVVVARKNALREAKVQEERAVRGALPARKIEACQVALVRGEAGSTGSVDRNVYSVDSKLIGAKVETRKYAERIEVWYGPKMMEDMPRLRGRGGHRIEYRHIIDWLVRKPGACAAYRHRDDLFPVLCFKRSYDLLRRARPPRAEKERLGILDCAAKEGESRTRAVPEAMLEAGETPHAAEAKERVVVGGALPEAALGWAAPVDLAAYGTLLAGTAAQEVIHERAA